MTQSLQRDITKKYDSCVTCTFKFTKGVKTEHYEKPNLGIDRSLYFSMFTRNNVLFNWTLQPKTKTPLTSDDHHRERVDPVKRIIDDIGLTTRNGEWTKWCYILKRGGEGSRGQDWLFSLIYSLGSLSLRPPFCADFLFVNFFLVPYLLSFFPFFFGPSSSFWNFARIRMRTG